MQNRLNANHVEKVATDPNALCVSYFSARRQIESLVAPCGDFSKTFLPLANLLPDRKCQLGVLA
jgi:hypothetical protein